MSEDIQHYDIDGNPITLHRLCTESPGWAKNIIERLRSDNAVLRVEAVADQKKINDLQAVIAKLKEGA